MSEPVYHALGKCRWCGSRFTKLWHHWVCERAECSARQLAHALKRGVEIPDKSPYLYVPLPLQVDIEESPIRNLLVHGPAGISKSYGARMHLYTRSRMIPGYQSLLLRCTYKQLEDNHLRYMEAEAEALGDAEYKAGTPKRVVFENGSEIRFGFCEDESDIWQHTGQEWDEVIPEEAVHFLPKAIREICSRARGNALSREAREALGGIKGRSRLLTNPGGRAALFLDDFYIKRDPNRSDFPKYKPKYYGNITGDISDNPYLESDFEDVNLGGLDADRFEQLAHGRWDIFPGQFFRAFDPSKHVVAEDWR